jgi:hypothetical protein
MTAIVREAAIKKWAWVLMGVAGLLLLSLLVVIILAAAYDYNKLKPQATEAVLGPPIEEGD